MLLQLHLECFPIIVLLGIALKEVDIHHSFMVVMIIHNTEIHLGTVMVDRILMGMVLTIIIMEAGETRNVEIKTGVVNIISMVGVTICSHKEGLKGLLGHLLHHLLVLLSLFLPQ